MRDLFVVGSLIDGYGVPAFIVKNGPPRVFGRSAVCDIRFGHEPVHDQVVPPVAGRFLVVADDRVAVENLSERLAFDVTSPDNPLEAVRPGGLYSPPGDGFEVRFSGARRVYPIKVRVISSPRPVSDLLGAMEGESDACLEPDLTPRQWQILAAYARPIRAGRPVSATHAEVARTIGWSSALVRLESGSIWKRLVSAGVPMRDFPDKRDAIADAAIRHCLFPAPVPEA